MLPTPKKVTLVAGGGDGRSRLTAFDKALLEAGIGNLNLIKVSSILPPGVQLVEELSIPAGSLAPTAYGALISDEEGEIISAAVGIGFSPRDHGMIMEFSGKCSGAEAEKVVTAMVEESFDSRGMVLDRIAVRAVERRVGGVSAVVAAAVLWY